MAAPDQARTTQVRALRTPAEPRTIVLVISGSIDRAEIPEVCASARGFLEAGDEDEVICDVSAVVDPDVVAIDALARLQLTARRLGFKVRLRHACNELQELLTITGLNDVLPLRSELPLEPRGQFEEREQPRGVEEETDPGDLTV